MCSHFNVSILLLLLPNYYYHHQHHYSTTTVHYRCLYRCVCVLPVSAGNSCEISTPPPPLQRAPIRRLRVAFRATQSYRQCPWWLHLQQDPLDWAASGALGWDCWRERQPRLLLLRVLWLQRPRRQQRRRLLPRIAIACQRMPSTLFRLQRHVFLFVLCVRWWGQICIPNSTVSKNSLSHPFFGGAFIDVVVGSSSEYLEYHPPPSVLVSTPAKV